MPSLPFRILNVFTRNQGTLTGNPLCVFENAASLDSTTMQALARQFNLSETTFILPSSRANAHVRIFTPDYEMPFAGHPTLGTAFVCRALQLGGDDLTLEMQAGIIPVKAQGARWTLQANAPTARPVDAQPEALAAMLGLQPSDIGANPSWIKAGKEQLIIPLNSEDAVRRARPDSAAFAAIKSEDGHSMAYIFAQTAPGRLLSRFFFPSGSAILEDPATGSATANLGGWLLAQQRELPLSYEISQGEYVGRPSTLYLSVSADRRILVSGDVIELGRGAVQL
ncbi:MAG TPA: PhzF family phenazine biosynthesis protein [Povalibacter sp.]|nr:PhzF family phenazine biosynthesis protein [Povalibacter sp.]